MSKDPGWWSDWFIPLLFASGILLIFKDGLALTIILWFLYLGKGAKTVEANPRPENKQELRNHTVTGIIVIIISIILKIAAKID